MSFKTSKYASSFSPQDLPGLVVWLDAADSRTLTMVGSNVSRWNDKVTNGTQRAESNIFTGPTLGTVNGVQALRYTTGLGTGMMYFGSSYTPKTTGFSYFFAFSPTSLTTPGARLFHAYTATDRLFQINSNVIDVITGAGRAFSQTTPVHDNLTIVTAFEDTSAISILLNGSLATSAPTPAATAASTITQASVGTGFAGADRLDGFMCEILFYNRTMPIAERQLVEGYLRRKWSRTFSSNHPYAIVPPFTRPFIPLDVSGCSLWLDADDNRTLTLSGSNVTQWNDKSGNGHTATASGAARPTYSSSSRYLLFNGTSNCLALSTGALPSGNSAYSIFIVAYTNNAATPQWILAGGNEATNQLLGVFFYITNAVWHSWWINEYAVNNSITNGVPSIINVNYSTNRTTITNGGTPTTNNPNATRSNSTGNNFIGRLANTADQFLNGGIGEIVIFSREISTGERQQVELYLAEKWNLRPSLSTSNALRLYRALSPVFNPTLLSNCALWVDAADFSTFVLSGTNVTTWKDKSGNGRDVSGYNNTATYNSSALGAGYPGLEFSSTRSMRVTIPAGTFSNGVHGFIVYRFTGPELYGFAYGLLNRSVSSSNALPSPFTMYAINMNDYRFIGNGTGGSYNITSGNRYVTNTSTTFYNFWLRSTANTTWNDSINGTTASHTTGDGVGAYGDTASDVVIGGRLDTAVFYQGVISEVILYSNALVDADRRVVEGYLAEKWGLARNLPNNHPYKTTPV
jgi:hypothetical protein